MSSKLREKTPPKIADEVMFLSDHTCCVCGSKGKAVQIHHIDGDDSNNAVGNLMVLCVEHHDAVTRKSSIGRGYSKGELKRYKTHWEYHVKKSRGLIPKKIESEKPLNPIQDIITEALSLPDNDKRVIEKLNKLYEIHLWLGYEKEIREGLGHLSLMAGLSGTKLTVRLCGLIYEMNWQYVGPEDVPMGKKEEEKVKQFIGFLKTIGKFAGEHNRKISIITALCDSLADFNNIAISYNNESIENQVLRAFLATKKATLYKFAKEDKRFLEGSKKINNKLTEIKENLQKDKPKWDKSLKFIDKIIRIT